MWSDNVIVQLCLPTSSHTSQAREQGYGVVSGQPLTNSTTPRDVTGDEPSSTFNRLSSRSSSWIYFNRTVIYLFIHWIWTHGKDGEWNVFTLKGF